MSEEPAGLNLEPVLIGAFVLPATLCIFCSFLPTYSLHCSRQRKSLVGDEEKEGK